MRVSLRWVAIDVVEVGGFGLHADVSLLWVFKQQGHHHCPDPGWWMELEFRCELVTGYSVPRPPPAL